jgi:opacity protein-like surface antigen
MGDNVTFRSMIFAAASATSLAITATAAFAQDKVGLYGRIDSGWSFGRDIDGGDVGDSYIIGGGVGYRFTPNFRTDVTIGYRGGYDLSATETIGANTLAGEADLKSWAGLINVYYDFANASRFTPYIGAGIGVARNKLDDVPLMLNGASVGTLNGDSKTNVAWQLSLGTAIRVSQGISLDVGYRYMDLGKFQSADTGTVLGAPVTGVRSEDDLRAHEIQVGLRFDF